MSLENLTTKLLISKSNMNKVSRSIKDLETLLKTGCFSKSFEFQVQEDFKIYWCKEKKRLMAEYLKNTRPLIEHPLEARLAAHEKWDDLINAITKIA